MGGEPGKGAGQKEMAQGLSPRGRGTQALEEQVDLGLRSIPAWAGNPSTRRPPAQKPWVYPRVGGEPSAPYCVMKSKIGLSPRGRGTQLLIDQQAQHIGSIPAWAGNPSQTSGASWCGPVYPRVGGEPLDLSFPHVSRNGLSPRGRGTQLLIDLQAQHIGSIPAWAGNPD